MSGTFHKTPSKTTQNSKGQSSGMKQTSPTNAFKTTTKKLKASTNRPLYPEPSMKNGMGAHYNGLYAKTFYASSLNGDYRSRSTIARLHEHKTREDNNMLGLTNKYD